MSDLLKLSNSFDLQKIISEAPNKHLWMYTLEEIDDSFCNREWQSSSMFIVYMRKGHLHGVLNGQKHKIDSPACIIINKGDTFSITSCDKTLHLSIIATSIDTGNRLTALAREYAYTLMSSFTPIIKIPPQYVAECDNMYLWLVSHLSKAKSPTYLPTAIFALMKFVFATAYKFNNPDASKPEDNMGQQMSREFITLCYKHHISQKFLDFYANLLNISTKHLTRIVKLHTGITAVKWIEIFTIIDAKILLATTTLSIGEISDRLNFSSQSFFGKYFRRHAGISPKDYRKITLGS